MITVTLICEECDSPWGEIDLTSEDAASLALTKTSDTFSVGECRTCNPDDPWDPLRWKDYLATPDICGNECYILPALTYLTQLTQGGETET